MPSRRLPEERRDTCPSDDDDPSEERIRGLPIWKGVVSIEPLPGGITNRNYRVRDASGFFVARLGEDLPLLGVDRRNELACHRAAAQLGVAPPIVYAANGVLISHYVESRTLTSTDGRESNSLPRLASILRRLHDGWDALAGEFLYFSPALANRAYSATARRLGALLPDDIDELLDDDRQNCEPRSRHLCLRFATTTCCRQTSWIPVAGSGSSIGSMPESATRSSTSRASPPTLRSPRISTSSSLSAYRGAFDENDLRELRILKTSSLLRECLWSVVQTVTSDLNFDYRAYGDASLDRYRAARVERDSK